MPPKAPKAAPEKFRITIDSVLGGETPLAYFAAKDQYLPSLGINPFMPLGFSGSNGNYQHLYESMSAGLIRPHAYGPMTANPIAHWPAWMDIDPKLGQLWVYDSAGSAYTSGISTNSVTAISDAGGLSLSSGNGMAYSDNYVYFAKNTTIARYGPLDGSATLALDPNYWAGTLGKTPLVNTAYPGVGFGSFTVPNHFLHRHSDGRLYIADVIGNQGTISFIKTTKTSFEGDTDEGSTQAALSFGYGLWPTAIESYGSDIVIALYEGNASTGAQRAHVAFWDTNSQNFNQITFPEYADTIITGIKNINGTLYFVSGNPFQNGYRVTRYIGGSSFEEVDFVDSGSLPLPGSLDGNSGRLLVGTSLRYDSSGNEVACVISYGQQKAAAKPARFNIMRGVLANAVAYTCLKLIPGAGASNLSMQTFFAGFGSFNSGTGNQGIDKEYGITANYATYAAKWRTQIYKLGRPFKITKISAPIISEKISFGVGQIAKNAVIDMTAVLDSNRRSVTVSGAISSSTVDIYNRFVNRPTDIQGGNDFFLEFDWSGTDFAAIGLPMTIDGEFIGDN